MSFHVRVVVVLIGAVVCIAAPAGAAPVSLGAIASQNPPRVIVDATGQGYTSWADNASGNALDYCRLLTASASCAPRQSYAYPAGPGLDSDSGNAPVFTAAGGVALLDSRCCQASGQKFLYLSPDGGQTFGAPSQLTQDNASGMGRGDVIDVPAGAVAPGLPEELVTTDAGAVTGGGSIQGTPLTSDNLTPGFYTPAVESGSLSESVARQGSTLVAVYTQASTPSRRVSWVADTGGDPNAPASWSAPQDVAPQPSLDSHAQLTSGPSGIFMARSVATPGDNEAVVVQKFTGSGWSSPTTISTTAAGEGFALDETPAGIVYVIWNDRSAGALQYKIANNATGTSYGAPITLVKAATIGYPSIAVNAAGSGWATWTGGANQAFALPILPTPTTTNLPLSDGGRLGLATPRSCVPPGARFTVTLGFNRSKRKGAVYVKVTRVDFSLVGTRLKTVRHASFRATLTLRASNKRGSTVKVRARATLKVHHGKPPTKSIYAKLTVCS